MCVLLDTESEGCHSRSSAGGFEPVPEAISSSDPYIARAQIGGHRATPSSDRGSQVNLALLSTVAIAIAITEGAQISDNHAIDC